MAACSDSARSSLSDAVASASLPSIALPTDSAETPSRSPDVVPPESETPTETETETETQTETQTETRTETQTETETETPTSSTTSTTTTASTTTTTASLVPTDESTELAAGADADDGGGISPWWLLVAVAAGVGLGALYFMRRAARHGEHGGGNASGL
jgi:cobalamin biosynthesis Mg chelatase CobN